MDYIISTGLIENNLISIDDKLSVYTDIMIYEDIVTQSVLFTFIGKESGLVSIFDLQLEECEFIASISEETGDGEYITRVEIRLSSDDCKIIYKDSSIWSSTYYEDELYITLPNGVVIYYSEENGFMDGDTLKSLNGNDIS